MNRVKRVVPYILLVVVCLTVSACGSKNQSAYRGDPGGTPGIRVTPLSFGITQQQLANMNPAQYNELMRRIDRYNSSMREASYNEAYDAYAKKQWINNPEGGPPIMPGQIGGKAPKVKKEKPGVIEKEGNKFIQTTIRTTSKELNKAWKNSLKGIFD